MPPSGVRTDVPLAACCSLELGGRARYFAEVTDPSALGELLAWSRAERVAVAVLGGGSNVVVADEGFDGLVLRIALRGIEASMRGREMEVTVAAGEPWDAVVALAAQRGWAGIECLSGIPGLAGATPIQNVGAYGQDVAETIREVRVVDRASGIARTVTPAECEFAYRDSAFKRPGGALADAIVVSVTFALRPTAPPAVRYPELARALAERRIATPSLGEVREVVIALRRAKSMVLDPNDDNRRSVGSFFTNPIVDAERADEVVAIALERRLVETANEVPSYDAGAGRRKLAAGWLIERSGFHKGLRRGAFGISSRHALALVHHGGGTSRDLLAFAREIQATVRAQFGVALELEPVMLGPAGTR